MAWVKQHYREVRDRLSGTSLVFGGELETTRRSFDSLTYAFGLAVLLIHLILAAQIKSYALLMEDQERSESRRQARAAANA